MNALKLNKKNFKMNNLIIETNQHLKNISTRKQNGIDAAIASSQLEGIYISREIAMEISNKVEDDIKKFLQ